MEFIVVSTLNGFVYGLLLFMVSAGLTLIFGMMGVVNFAHASLYMLGAYLSFTITRATNFWVGLLIAPLIVATVGIFIERFMLRRVHGFGHSQQLLLTFGIAFVVEEVVKVFWGNFPIAYRPPGFLSGAAFTIFGTNFPSYRVFVAVVAILLLGMLYLLLQKTRIGIIVRASVQRPAMVSALGHNVPLIFLGVFGVGAWMAGLAGAVGGALLTTSPTMAAEMSVIAFVVVVVGGLGSLLGAFISSLLIGLLTSFSVGFQVSLADLANVFGFGDAARRIGGLLTLDVASLSASLPALLMLIVLLTRPAGLMGDRN
ncbi:branched-chain amino acid ABC transporter permease [Microvirga puerhi]|uniref:Branched-chain amino acid ABC transporter permease n=1 Tax=Microvirga puerhi TaxID=2876078 RepID=A0ABS7VT39_9HYPH|nr:branched-chain amino acid ABC transporter permease [Microvirga puerhi]MBZ6078724.1 branched-chain amino acid ABC transporter permease [Microvirga puerhi]